MPSGKKVRIGISLPAPAPVALDADHVNFGASSGYADADPDCTGSNWNPTAPPGKVCIYSFGLSGIDQPEGTSGRMSNRFGFAIQYASNGANNDYVGTGGVWAYTAPRSARVASPARTTSAPSPTVVAATVPASGNASASGPHGARGGASHEAAAPVRRAISSQALAASVSGDQGRADARRAPQPPPDSAAAAGSAGDQRAPGEARPDHRRRGERRDEPPARRRR